MKQLHILETNTWALITADKFFICSKLGCLNTGNIPLYHFENIEVVDALELHKYCDKTLNEGITSIYDVHLKQNYQEAFVPWEGSYKK